MRFGYNQFEDQYNLIKQSSCGRQACSVLIFVALEVNSHINLDFSLSFTFSWLKYQVDAMAATKMLTQLLRSDNIAYNLKPVANFDEVVQSMQDLVTSDIKTVFLINCGAVSFYI